MGLKDRIVEDIKVALKDGEKIKLNTLRMLLAQIKQFEIDKKISAGDEDIINILLSNVKQRREAINQFEKGNRKDLVEKETQELAIIQAYLPEPMSDAEVEKIIDTAIQEVHATGIRDLGKVMKIVIPKTRGRVDSAKVSAMAKQKLNK